MSIEAMKLAWEVFELAQKEVEWQFKSPVRAQVSKAQKALRAAIEQAEKQEPIAYIDAYGQVYNQHELNGELRVRYLMKMSDAPTPLYCAPPKREWKGLTDEEIWDIYCDAKKQTDFGWLWNAHAIEARLKDKNTQA